MWTYITRRLLLMVPTLFGVTVVSFGIMQLAPGDPLISQFGAAGAGSGQTRESYLIQKRDLKLDKPILVNFNYFRDFSQQVEFAADYSARPVEQIEQELAALALEQREPARQVRLEFLKSLKIDDFTRRLRRPDQRGRLARAVLAHVQVFCEDQGRYAVPAVIDLLHSAESPIDLKIGAIRCLNHMVPNPFVYTYSRNPQAAETPVVTSTWRVWWERSREEFPQVAPERRAALEKALAELAAETSRGRLMERLADFDRDDVPYFADKLLEESSLEEKNVASLALRLFVADRLRTDVPVAADAELVEQVATNWVAHYNVRRDEYEPGLASRLWYIVADTQYAHMVWRLATFNFGRSALKTREPVGEKIWRAVKVSAPLMLMAQAMIYLVAVPLGIVCAVKRGRWGDRFLSLFLFLLYSIPPFVAGMLFLLFLCYGKYLKLFPMLGLHSQGADEYGAFWYAADYVWHIILPVTCLALFSLAGLAMYSRTSMLEVIQQDYIRTARAKGVGERKVILKHALRNSLIPIITLFANFIPAMLGGSVLIEYLFGIPGMGRLSWASIEQKDFPTLMALIYIDAIVVMISILISDLLYVLVDPRIGFEGQGGAA